ncbi:MAG: FecR family protein [Bacteroidales bacterium]
MKIEYIKYTVEELLDEELFVAWVLNEDNDTAWKKFLTEHPEMSKTEEEARSLILTLHNTTNGLSEDEVFRIWHNIQRFEQMYAKRTRVVKLHRRLAVVASFVLIMSVGVLSLIRFGNNNQEYQFASSDSIGNNGEAMLLLADGKEHVLEKNKSTIAINNDNEIVINDEKTIELSQNDPSDDKEVKMNEVIVPYGKSSELLLVDGTKVWLNAGSKLAFPAEFSGNSRKVFLEGEACFKVTKNTGLPFIVSVNDLDVKVLGTHFNVSAYPADNNIETVLIEGKVELSKNSTFSLGKKGIVMKPFQKATFSKGAESIVLADEPDADIYIAWTEGWFQFSKQSLREVFSKLERYYNASFMFAPGVLESDKKISGKLDLKSSLEDVVKALSDVAQISYEVEDDKITISKNDDKS